MLALQLKQYTDKTLTNILSSQFIYSSVQEKPQLKKQQLIIHSPQQKKTHYLYLFLTAKQKPYARKYYSSWKSASQKLNAIKSKSKSVSCGVHFSKNTFYENIAHMLFNIIPSQTNAERPVLSSNAHALELIIPYAPLTSRTISLQSKNSYMTDIPLIWRVTWTNTTLFQKIFILKHLRILNQSGLKRLDI
jgi:hypothetical protein